jgi:hypothetical protein
MNYKLDGSWTAIPTAALASTYGGTYHIAYPEATDYTGLGVPCAAWGLPSIHIAATRMSDTGFAFWRGRFVDAAALSALVSIEVWNPRNGIKEKWLGTLRRPQFSHVSVGSDAAKTIYHDVVIEIMDCELTT